MKNLLLMRRGQGTVLKSIIVSSLLFASCNKADKSPAFDLATAKKEIEEADRNFVDLLKKRDSVGLANCYTKDAKFMGPNGPAVSGRENIQKSQKPFVESGIILDIASTDVWGDESMLAEEGTWAMSIGGQQLDKGKYIVLWKKEDGKWKIFRDIINSDLPVPASK
jgi:uncharacterized protein (TIGR02246 family)